MMQRFIAIASMVFLIGCAYPATHDEQGAAQAGFYFPGAQPNERVSIDGRDAGMTSSYTGKQILSVTPGTHRVVVTTQGGIVIDKKYYMGAGARIAIQ